MNIMISLDGVLRSHTGGPISEGIALYRALAGHTIVLATEDSKELAEHWLRLERLNIHTNLLTADVSLRDHDVRAGQIRYCSGIACRIEMLVDPDPSRCAYAMSQGITSMLFAQPKYARPEFRPDRKTGVRPWAEISDELDRQALVSAEDTRT